MKKILITLLTLFLLSANSQSQEISTGADTIVTNLKNIEREIGNSSFLVTRTGLNNFFAKKIGYFLTGNDNPSLNRNYLFLDVGDNDLVFGHNRFFTKKNKQIKSVLTYGFKADLKDKFAELITQDGLKGNFGANLKFTYYFNGSIKYDGLWEKQSGSKSLAQGKQKRAMNHKRKLFLMQQIEKLKQEDLDYVKAEKSYSNDASGKEDSDYLQETSKKFYKDLQNKYLEAYYNKEAELLDDWEAKTIVHTSWISVTGFLPFTPKSYSVITSASELPHEKKSYLANGSLNYYHLIEHRKTGKWLLNIGGNIEYNNSIKNEDIDKYTINDLKKLGLNDSVYINQKEGDVYYGAFQEYVSGKLLAEVIYFPKIKNCKFFTGDWGVSVKYEYTFDGLNDKANMKFGLPFILKGKDDSPINFELQFKCNDINRWTSDKKKFSLGISVGLPFSSILYKEK